MTSTFESFGFWNSWNPISSEKTLRYVVKFIRTHFVLRYGRDYARLGIIIIIELLQHGVIIMSAEVSSHLSPVFVLKSAACIRKKAWPDYEEILFLVMLELVLDSFFLGWARVWTNNQPVAIAHAQAQTYPGFGALYTAPVHHKHCVGEWKPDFDPVFYSISYLIKLLWVPLILSSASKSSHTLYVNTPKRKSYNSMYRISILFSTIYINK